MVVGEYTVKELRGNDNTVVLPVPMLTVMSPPVMDWRLCVAVTQLARPSHPIVPTTAVAAVVCPIVQQVIMGE